METRMESEALTLEQYKAALREKIQFDKRVRAAPSFVCFPSSLPEAPPRPP